MEGIYGRISNSNKKESQNSNQYEEMISFLRSRLNIIGASVYLIQAKLAEDEKDVGKYFRKINEEIESIRKVLNQ